MADPIRKSFRQRAADAADLAAQTKDPLMRQACLDLADGWSRLARQEEAMSGPGVITAGEHDKVTGTSGGPTDCDTSGGGAECPPKDERSRRTSSPTGGSRD